MIFLILFLSTIFISEAMTDDSSSPSRTLGNMGGLVQTTKDRAMSAERIIMVLIKQ